MRTVAENARFLEKIHGPLVEYARGHQPRFYLNSRRELPARRRMDARRGFIEANRKALLSKSRNVSEWTRESRTRTHGYFR